MSDYILYTANNCHECAEVIAFVDSISVNIKKINVDQLNPDIPIKIFAYPALFKDKELICYGSDVKNYFRKTKEIKG